MPPDTFTHLLTQPPETRLANTQDALVDAEQARVDALAAQAALDEQRRLEVATAEQELTAQAEREAANSRRETDLALARAEQERVDALAAQAATLDEQRRLEVARAEQDAAAQVTAQAEREAESLRRRTEAALARAEQERADALATQAATLDEQRRLEVARAEQDATAQAEREAELALARADLERQGDLAAQRTELEQERERALAAAAEELAPYIQAQEAKNQIVEELNENFGDFDNSAVEIDPETGTVKLHFQESYFALGSHELSEEMKSFLRADDSQICTKHLRKQGRCGASRVSKHFRDGIAHLSGSVYRHIRYISRNTASTRIQYGAE